MVAFFDQFNLCNKLTNLYNGYFTRLYSQHQ